MSPPLPTSVISIDRERVCLYQQFDDTYPIILGPYITRSAYRHHIHRINAHWRRASLLYLLTLLGFLMFCMGPILLGAAVNEHNLTGVDEEVGVAMLILGVATLATSVVLVRVVSRRRLLEAVAAENDKLKTSVPQMRFRVQHATMLLPVKRVEDSEIVIGTTGQQQQHIESSEYGLFLEVEQTLAGAAAAAAAAAAEATQLLSISHFSLDPTSVLYQHNLCPHCLHDTPQAALPLAVYPIAPLYSMPATHPAVSPLLAAHLLSTLPRSAYMQSPITPTTRSDSVTINIAAPPTDTATHAADPQHVEAPSAATLAGQ